MATYTVTTTSDVVDPTDGQLSLREALALADGDASTADMINFAPAVQGGTIVLGGSQLTVASDVTIAGGDGVTLDADGLSRVLLVEAASETDTNEVTLSNLTIIGGNAVNEGGGGVHAGGHTTLELDHVRVSDNSTTGTNSDGGGIYGYRITLNDSLVAHNSSADSGGGIVGLDSVVLIDSAVSYNSGNALGGGVRCIGSVSLTNSAVSGNRAEGDYAQGGGIFAGEVTLTNSAVSSNEAVAANGICEGGGLYGLGVTLIDSTVNGNRTRGGYGRGGGISGNTLNISSSVVSDNAVISATSKENDPARGGGIYGDYVTLTNSTLSGNTVFGDHVRGGGVYVRSDGSITLINSTITANSVRGGDAAGGGVLIGTYEAHQASATIANSIVAGNTATGDVGSDIAGHISATNGLNVFGSDVDGSAPSDRQNVSTSVLFNGGLADHGGPTQTIALLDDPANPALGRADPAQAPATDQRGELRPEPAGTNPDIGAFELDQSRPSPPPVAQTFTVTTVRDVVDRADGQLSLREALALADSDNSTADRIEFAPQVQGQTIALRGGELTVRSDVTVDGGTGVTIDAHEASRVLLVQGFGTDVQLQHLTITGGHTRGDYSGGGGIHADTFTTLMLDHVAVTGNGTAGDNANGGGIDGDRVMLLNSTVSGNSAIASGGGVFANYVTLTNSLIAGNTADSGGGIFGNVTVNDSIICDNIAASIGGGIFGNGALANSTVAHNSAGDFAGGVSGFSLSLSNCTVADNSGGGIFGDGSLNSCTVTSNTEFGIEVTSFVNFQLNNCIIAGNSDDVIAGGDGPGTVISNGHNIFGSAVVGAVAGDLQNVSTGLLFAGELADNGGPTPTIGLRDAADNPALAGADPTDAPATDQRGEVRPQPEGTAPDIGAFELNQSGGGLNEIVGTRHDDFLRGTADADLIRGLAGDDRLWGRDGDDQLFGGAGRDVLAGKGGIDEMTGGNGADRFLFRHVADAPVSGPSYDEILDFRRAQHDQIELRPIDARAGADGDQKFTFIGEHEFTQAGQLRLEPTADGDFLVSGNTDRDLDAEFAFVVQTGVEHLKAADFLL